VEQSDPDRHLKNVKNPDAQARILPLVDFGPTYSQDQIDILQQAFELACRTFERRRQLSTTELDLVARAVCEKAKLELRTVHRLATKAILRVAMSAHRSKASPP
jgi:hypothetical protein